MNSLKAENAICASSLCTQNTTEDSRVAVNSKFTWENPDFRNIYQTSVKRWFYLQSRTLSSRFTKLTNQFKRRRKNKNSSWFTTAIFSREDGKVQEPFQISQKYFKGG